MTSFVDWSSSKYARSKMSICLPGLGGGGMTGAASACFGIIVSEYWNKW